MRQTFNLLAVLALLGALLAACGGPATQTSGGQGASSGEKVTIKR
jgi:hypothetical protein